MKAKVTKKGLIIPKELLEDVEEVEIHKENNLIVIVLSTKIDPILEFGKHPVSCLYLPQDCGTSIAASSADAPVHPA